MRTPVPDLAQISLVDSEIKHVDQETDGEILSSYYALTLCILCNDRTET
jgi:hypothetical protein